MAADPEIRVSVTAVTGEAAAALKQFADQQSAIQQRLVAAQYSLTNATNAYKEALKQLVPAGAAANEVNTSRWRRLTTASTANRSETQAAFVPVAGVLART
jgi:hypothetical protein